MTKELTKNEARVLECLEFSKVFIQKGNIANRGKISIQTVSPTIKKLENKGIILGYTGVINWEAIGYMPIMIEVYSNSIEVPPTPIEFKDEAIIDDGKKYILFAFVKNTRDLELFTNELDAGGFAWNAKYVRKVR